MHCKVTDEVDSFVIPSDIYSKVQKDVNRNDYWRNWAVVKKQRRNPVKI